MTDPSKPSLSTSDDASIEPPNPDIGDAAPNAPAPINWPDIVSGSSDNEIKTRVNEQVKVILSQSGLARQFCCIGLMDPKRSIGSFDSDFIYGALTALNPDKARDVLLVLLSPGGSIEPAYQIAKLCKSFSKDRFVVAVPRQAKSAATLIAIGADEIHMGPLSQLGPIDPQLGGLPALGVVQALQSLASLSEKHPGSAEMFARYLRMALTVEQIGYCERISESAAQYAERLLSTKPFLAERASRVARDLVYEYKDHGFVIDLEEAQGHLGSEWTKTGTSELSLAEELYNLFDWVNLLLSAIRSKRLVIVGRLDNCMIFDDKQT